MPPQALLVLLLPRTPPSSLVSTTSNGTSPNGRTVIQRHTAAQSRQDALMML
jgi:hypothetical protein